MEDRLCAACGRFLGLLPECGCGPERLARALSRFEIGPRAVERAAQALPEHYELELRGVRLLISEYLDAFCGLFEEGAPRCEVSVPAPGFLITALQAASGGSFRFLTGALIIQVVLRSFFLWGLPFGTGAAMQLHYCGLNRAREYLLSSEAAPELLLQFGVLCDECLKCGEAAPPGTRVLNLALPKGEGPRLRELAAVQAEDFLARAGEAMGVQVTPSAWLRGLESYLALQRLQSRLALLQARRDRLPPGGNAFALAQTAQLAVFDRWEGLLAALGTYADELEAAPPDDGSERTYCFYTPFLQPWVDARLRQGCVRLMGSAVFLRREISPVSLRPGPLTAAWLEALGPRMGGAELAEAVAEEVSRLGCTAYLGGMFDFDRWMGPAHSFIARSLAARGIPSFSLRGDFWNESPCRSEEELENICAAISARRETGKHP